LPPNWWTSWGIREKDEDLTQLVKDMNLKDIWEDMYKKVKEVGKCGLQMDTYGKLKITMLNNCQVHKLNFSLD
jgi:hypothetical protein